MRASLPAMGTAVETVSPIAARSRNNRSAVSNGRREFVVDGDGRSVWCRRWRDLMVAHLDDLGGEDIASAAQVALSKRAATLESSLNVKRQPFHPAVLLTLRPSTASRAV